MVMLPAFHLWNGARWMKYDASNDNHQQKHASRTSLGYDYKVCIHSQNTVIEENTR